MIDNRKEMNFIYAAKWLKKLFGVNSVRKSDIEQASEMRYVFRYEDTSEFNMTSIVANKLSNIVCVDAGAEIKKIENQSNTDNKIKKDKMIDFLSESFRRCFSNLNLITARAFGIGGVVLKPYIYNGAIYTDIIPQNRFFVIEQHGEVVTKAGFISDIVTREEKNSRSNNVKRTRYTRLEYHSLEEGVYTIENKVIACDADKNSGAKERETTLEHSPFADKPSRVSITGVKQMLFGFLKCPLDNKRDFSSIYGVPVTYGQDKIIKLILDLLNEIPDEYKNKKAFIGADDILFDSNDRLPKDGLYRLFRAMGSVDNAPFWETFSPEIRHASYFEGLNYLFGLLEKSICVNQGMLTDLKVGNATATAIKRSTLDTFSTVHSMRRNLESSFNSLIYAVAVIAEAFDLCGGGSDYRVQFDWDYRLLEDTGETWNQMIAAYNAGAAERWELRRYIFGEDRDSAQAVIDNIAGAEQTTGTDDTIMQEESPCPDSYVYEKSHEVRYDGELCASKIFAPSGRFDEAFNPFRRETWNMNEQTRIYRDNPEIADFLMREAKN